MKNDKIDYEADNLKCIVAIAVALMVAMVTIGALTISCIMKL
jgi:hypothetical protein